ncbi:hypothetical protein [Nocardia wallacei]|uniref:Uncharacterized protein n=1 Tax=Nocardia wallacei TaxID=480035 RepID=A0A7G1KUP8_9NOCA|nr:hypothetical protein [Nocardia wallacei]BCK58995.1 hypothetical protein NWFMUON74_67670 [Nocardia wallacei]
MGSTGGPQPSPDAAAPAPAPSKDFLTEIHDAAIQARIQPFAQKLGASEQRVGQIDSKLGDLGAGTDPAYTSSDDHFQGMSHEALYEAVNGFGGLDPKGLQTMRQAWFDCSNELENLSTFTLMLGMNNIFGHGLWKGTAADTAQVASERYARVANQIGQVFESVAMRLDGLAWAAEAVRTAVQPPPDAVPLTPTSDNPGQAVLPLLPNPQAIDQAETQREKARQDAIRALESIYTPTFPPAGTNVPAYLDVPKATGGDDGTSTNAGWNNGGTGPGEGRSNPTSASPESPEAQDSQPPSPSATNPTGLGLPGGLLPNGAGPDPAPTTAAGVHAAAGAPGNIAPAGDFGGRTAGPSVSQLGSPGDQRPGMPGVGVPGVPGGDTGAGLARSTAGARPGTVPGSVPHGAQGRRNDRDEEDQEHRTPDYLKRVQPDWTAGLPAPAGVIGADAVSEGVPADDSFATQPDHAAVQFSDRDVARASAPEPPVPPVEGVEATSYSPEPVARDGGSPAAEDADEPVATDETPRYITISGTGPMMEDVSSERPVK